MESELKQVVASQLSILYIDNSIVCYMRFERRLIYA
jgi:hypothetical protein